jgi:feruloyl esterase
MRWICPLVLGVIAVGAATPVAAATCESLRSFTIRQGTIASAEVVPAGPFVQPGRGGRTGAAADAGRGGAAAQAVQARTAAPAPQAARAGGPPPAPVMLPEHCRVKIVLRPSSDSHINAELWLPTTTWNGKFMAVGNGGFGGAIQGYGEMALALARGYATAGNDTGHSAADGPGGMFALGHPEKIVDFAYRAMHEMTAQSKRIIDEMYGRGPQFSYYKGCSTGGRQGVMAAQRYPEDFDGIIAGALANRHIHQHTAGVARNIELSRHPEQAISQAKAQLVTTAVMNACDTLKEGFLNNPRACSFDFKRLACATGVDTDSCLTAPQLKTVEAHYAGLKNSKGELIFSGQAIGNPMPMLRSTNSTPGGGFDTVRIWGFQNADYDWRAFNLDRDMAVIDRKVGFVDAVDPDLGDFKKRGGKLLLYAGWGDTTITPENTVLYYESVLKEMGSNQADWMRLFMVPGMGHCSGGPGPDTFDAIAALEQWREKASAPAQIMGSNRQTGLTRPICAYPQYAKYRGSGDLKAAANWACAAP